MDSVSVNSLANTAIKMSRYSNYDVLFIFVVLFSLAVTGFIVYYLLNRISKDYTALEKFSSVTLSNIQNTITEEFGIMQKSCLTHSQVASSMMSEGMANIRKEHSKLYNTVFGILSNTGNVYCTTEVAVDIFDTVMRLHCFDKAIILVEELSKTSMNTTEKEVLDKLSIKYRKITEDEYQLMSLFVYNNMHNLGAVLLPILETSEWNKFVSTKVKELVRINRTNRNVLDIIESVTTVFDEIIAEMRKTIIKNGGTDE